MNKKGISGVVVAILIVLIAVIAVSIFWMALKPTIEGTTEHLGKTEECLLLNLKIEKVLLDGTDLNVTVRRDAGEADLANVKVLVDGVEKLDGSKIFQLGTKTYTILDITKKPEKVEIAGFLVGDVLCPIIDTASGTEIEKVTA